ncbi:RIP homotypic interaction motif-containing protein [Streptomyces griseorubiginosus]|uniref:RIP homotypic interaction motif-containing protein n=1 Tax=Streptomyces griseorubiginosus TaxID=67304 RepID=UPI0033ADEA2B
MVVFVAWTVAALAALGLLAGLALGAAELHDRRSRKQRAVPRVRPLTASPRPAPEETAPATSPMPAPSGPVAESVIKPPVLGPLKRLTEIRELPNGHDPAGSDRDARPVIGTVLPSQPYDCLGLGRSGRDARPVIGTTPPALPYACDPRRSDKDRRLPISQVRPPAPPSPVSKEAPIIRSHVPSAVPVSQDPPAPPVPTLIPRASQVQPAPPSPALLVLACRGVQIGDDNAQFNTYTYKLQDPTVDFAKVLSDPAVRDALSCLIKDPENDELRAKATEALCAGKWTSKREELLDLGPLGVRSPRSDVTRDLKEMQGFITVRNCQGVQTGDSCYQRNDFIYVCRRATVNASSLLKSHPEVASSLIDAMVTPSQKKWKEPGEKLNAAVRTALNSPKSLDAIPDRSINVSPRITGVLRDHDGVSIGDRCRTADFKAVMVELKQPRNLPKCVVKESMRLMTAQRAVQPGRQASARSEPPSPPSAPPAPSGPPGPSRPSAPSAYTPRRSVTSASDRDRLPPHHLPRNPNHTPEPPSGPESPSSGRGFGL